MVVISGFISFTAVFVVFGIIAVSSIPCSPVIEILRALYYKRNVVRQKQRHGKWRVFVEPVDVIVVRGLSVSMFAR